MINVNRLNFTTSRPQECHMKKSILILLTIVTVVAGHGITGIAQETKPGSAGSAKTIEISSAVIRLIREIEIPARKAGVLAEVSVREGAYVGKGDLLGQIDLDEAIIERERARLDLKISEQQAGSHVERDLARNTVEEAQQKRQQSEMQHKIAMTQAENDVNVRLAQAELIVAQGELDRAKASKALYDKSVSQTELDDLQLKVDTKKLAIEQAQHEIEVAKMNAEANSMEIKTQEIIIERGELEIEQANEKREIAQLTREVKRNDVDKAELDLVHRRIVSPLNGEIAEIYKHAGEWVEPGERVMRVLQLDQLRAEGFVHISKLAHLAVDQDVELIIEQGLRETTVLKGKLSFISREVDPVNGDVLVWAEFENDNLQIRPGMRARMLIYNLEDDGLAKRTYE